MIFFPVGEVDTVLLKPDAGFNEDSSLLSPLLLLAAAPEKRRGFHVMVDFNNLGTLHAYKEIAPARPVPVRFAKVG
jgi:hypothetical protein